MQLLRTNGKLSNVCQATSAEQLHNVGTVGTGEWFEMQLSGSAAGELSVTSLSSNKELSSNLS